MKAGARAMAVAAVLMTAGMASASDDPEGKTAAAPTAAAPASSNASNSSHACKTLIKAMAGEWEGTIQTRNAEGMSSSSVVSATLRLEDSGKKLALYYEGFAFGKPADGAMLLSAAAGAPQGALSRDGATLTGTGAMDGAALTFNYEASKPSKKIARYEQVVTLNEPNRFVTELHSVDSAGKKTLAFRLDMSRLEGEQKSAAAESFSQSKSLLASARGAMNGLGEGGIQQAGVPTE